MALEAARNDGLHADQGGDGIESKRILTTTS